MKIVNHICHLNMGAGTTGREYLSSPILRTWLVISGGAPRAGSLVVGLWFSAA